MRLSYSLLCAALALVPAIAAPQASSSADSVLAHARALDSAGKRADALAAYLRYAGLEPNEPRAHELLGWVYLETGEHDLALKEFRAAVSLAPRRKSALVGVGTILVTLGRNEEALRAFGDAASLDPTDATLWGEMALAAETVGRPREAISYWERALVEAPGYFDGRPAERKEWEEAIARSGRQAPAAIAASATAASPPPPLPLPPLRTAVATQSGMPTRGADIGAGGTGRGGGFTSSGSGVVVARGGMVLTNRHVVRGCDAVRVRGDSGGVVKASVVALDSADDLALLQADGAAPPWPAATFRAGAPPLPGDDVIALGYPLNGLLADQVNVTTGSISALAGMYNDERSLQMSAPVQPGSSGGPLLDDSGNVVGVVVTKLNARVVAEAMGDIPQNVNFAIKGSVARAFLDAEHVAYAESPSTVARTHAEVGEEGRKSTVLVECWK